MELLPRTPRARNYKHGYGTGKNRSPEYLIWLNMRLRCLNPKHNRYHRYGGRGITICERWMSFVNFLEDVGRRPAPHLTFDRPDNDGNYEPGNWRWATRSEQARNRWNSKR